eukprot:scaffold4424_cov154-Skeletonema_menzelii.AAC.5
MAAFSCGVEGSNADKRRSHRTCGVQSAWTLSHTLIHSNANEGKLKRTPSSSDWQPRPRRPGRHAERLLS